MSELARDEVLPSSGRTKAVLLALLVCLALVVVWAYQLGQRLLAEHLAAEAGIVASENRVFCNSFGFAETSNEFARCATGLDNIRQKQRERLEIATIDLL